MIVERIRVEVGRTINTGNFESVRVTIGLEASVEEGDHGEAYKALSGLVKTYLNNEVRRQGDLGVFQMVEGE